MPLPSALTTSTRVVSHRGRVLLEPTHALTHPHGKVMYIEHRCMPLRWLCSLGVAGMWQNETFLENTPCGLSTVHVQDADLAPTM